MKKYMEKGGAIIRKTIGAAIILGGGALLTWGFWLLGAAIYYLMFKGDEMGDAAAYGFYYGILITSIGAVVACVGAVLFMNPNKFLSKILLTKKQKIAIWAAAILAIIFFGLGEKLLILKDDDKICQTYSAITMYEYPIGGEVGTYEKSSPTDDFAPRRLLSKEEKGLFWVKPVVAYRYVFVVVMLALCGMVLRIKRR